MIDIVRTMPNISLYLPLVQNKLKSMKKYAISIKKGGCL